LRRRRPNDADLSASNPPPTPAPATAAAVCANLREQIRFLDDGRVCLTNNAAERALRGVAVGRRNWTFAGSDAGGHRAAAVYTLIETCKMNDVDPQAWLADVLPGFQITRQQSRRPASVELEIGTSAERRGSLNTRRLIESPVLGAVTHRPGRDTARAPLRWF
jgi:hypothetical protein